MADREIHYEIVREDEHGFEPLDFWYSTLKKAKQALREDQVHHPDAFIVRVTLARLRPTRRAIAAI
ncbi:MAG: hypothetical protein OEY28_03790 [Nitrospira sp.]|nr:hypothetical protein [Nitrospira sp.]